jgi:hypothetical protein
MDDDARANRSHLEWGCSPLEDVVMSSYLLLHGAWHGAWCWDRVKPLLEAKGHTVMTPTFAGVGELSQLRRQPIGIDDHIGDITRVIWQQELRDLTIVAHSRVRHLVYLDAFFPIPAYPRVRDMLRLRHPPAWLRTWTLRLLWGMIGAHPLAPPPLRFLGITDPGDVRWVQSRLTKMPLRFCDGGRRFAPPPDALSTYIWCSGNERAMGEGFAPYARQALDWGWRYFEIDTGHDAMITAPKLVASILDSIGASAGVRGSVSV